MTRVLYHEQRNVKKISRYMSEIDRHRYHGDLFNNVITAPLWEESKGLITWNFTFLLLWALASCFRRIDVHTTEDSYYKGPVMHRGNVCTPWRHHDINRLLPDHPPVDAAALTSPSLKAWLRRGLRVRRLAPPVTEMRRLGRCRLQAFCSNTWTVRIGVW